VIHKGGKIVLREGKNGFLGAAEAFLVVE